MYDMDFVAAFILIWKCTGRLLWYMITWDKDAIRRMDREKI